MLMENDSVPIQLPFPVLKYKYNFQITYTEAILSKSMHSVAVMVWNLQNADCDNKSKFIVILKILFGTLSFPVVLCCLSSTVLKPRPGCFVAILLSTSRTACCTLTPLQRHYPFVMIPRIASSPVFWYKVRLTISVKTAHRWKSGILSGIHFNVT